MMTVANQQAPALRIAWVDTAKGLGITLVFYGHFVQIMAQAGMPGGLAQVKWIYAFHMPLFFFLAGFVYKDREQNLASFARREIRVRLIPALLFNAVVIPIWVADALYTGEPRGYAMLRQLVSDSLLTVLQGQACWNWLTWFLICLFTVEVWYFLLRSLVTGNHSLCLSIAVFVSLTILMHQDRQRVHEYLGIPINWWYVTSGVTAMVFYQCGILTRRTGWLDRLGSPTRQGAFCAACLAVTLLTFDLNRGPFLERWPFVMIKHVDYGNLALFFLTSFAGILFVVLFSRVLPASRILVFLGQITLPLLCLNGVLMRFGNMRILSRIESSAAIDTVWKSTLSALACTLASMAACLPAVWLMNRYLPLMLGAAARQRRAAWSER